MRRNRNGTSLDDSTMSHRAYTNASDAFAMIDLRDGLADAVKKFSSNSDRENSDIRDRITDVSIRRWTERPTQSTREVQQALWVAEFANWQLRHDVERHNPVVPEGRGMVADETRRVCVHE